jgi:hypothetical protein
VNLIRLQPNYPIKKVLGTVQTLKDFTEEKEKFLIGLLKKSDEPNSTDYIKRILEHHDLINNKFGNPFSIKIMS